MLGRTDLAIEMQEEIEEEHPIKGIHFMTKNHGDTNVKEVRIVVENEEGAARLGKPMGTYITLECEQLKKIEDGIHEPMREVLCKTLRQFIGNKNRILVVGLGNREVTSDALGPYVINHLYVTRHLLKEGILRRSMEISALSPGVMAQTGIESATMIKAIVKEIKPEIVFVIDSLAARQTKRLNSTIQIADTGITPGSGVGNHRCAINAESVGVPVVAIGVPTVVAVPTIINDAMDMFVQTIGKTAAKSAFKRFSDEERYELACEMVSSELETMYVTPKDVDEAVKRISFTISEAINKAVLA